MGGIIGMGIEVPETRGIDEAMTQRRSVADLPAPPTNPLDGDATSMSEIPNIEAGEIEMSLQI